MNQAQSDEDLAVRSAAGDRDAFGAIVARYQNLVCSLAYSRTGNLGRSEDIAQETFIHAWRDIRSLRDPGRLRVWLCGILRNRIYKDNRSLGREPVHTAEPLDGAPDLRVAGETPSETAVTREEEGILWRTLERIPEMYRDPLILYYREHQSVEAVAAQLDLSQEAVRQRLLRGRKLLQQELQAFVEDTLGRTSPKGVFSGAVLAALREAPSGASAGLGAAGKGAASAKSGILGAWLGSLSGVLGGMAAHWLLVRSAPSADERRFKRIAFVCFWVFVLLWCGIGPDVMRALHRHYDWGMPVFLRVMAGFWGFYAVTIAVAGVFGFRRLAGFRRDERQGNMNGGDSGRSGGSFSWFCCAFGINAGVHLAYFSWVVGLAASAGDESWVLIILALMLGLTVRGLVVTRGKAGEQFVRSLVGHHALLWVTVLGILNLRLYAWVAAMYGVGTEVLQRWLPAWVIPALTALLIGWVWLLVVVTRPAPKFPTPAVLHSPSPS